MKAASVSEIKRALKEQSREELIELCLKLARFKKENKEYLTYLIYESGDEDSYILMVKNEMEELFSEMNTNSFFYMKKTTRKILKLAKKYIRYSKKKQTEVEILLHFCSLMADLTPSIQRNMILLNIYHRQINSIQKTMDSLHEDLQYDYEQELTALLDRCPV